MLRLSFDFLSVGQRDFRTLLQDVEFSRYNAFATGSYSNLRTQVRSYFAFCVYFQRTPLPADAPTIYAFAQFLSRSIKPPSVKNYLSGVKMLHILHGLPYPYSQDSLLHLELRGIFRLNPHVPVRAIPVTPGILQLVHLHMDHSDSLHRSVWVCCLFSFYLMARLGSILPNSGSTESHKFLSHDRINFTSQGLLVTFLHTKTIQFGKRRLHMPLLRADSILCPVTAYHYYLSLLPSEPSGPAFLFFNNNKHKLQLLTTSRFITTFRTILKLGGVKHAASFTGHSFRRGGASWAFQSGVPGELIQICGDWASDSYKRYLEFSMDNKVHLAARLTRNLPC